MTQIRDNLSKLFAAFAVLFIAYIMLDWGMDLTSLRPGGSDVVGSVNGKKIAYREFSDLLRQATEAQKKQTGADPDAETERQIQNQVWNTLVTRFLIEQEIERLGVTVTDKEIVDMVHGPNPPEMLVSQFRDSTGTFNRAAYDRAIADPQNREAWLQVEQQLRVQRKNEKLQSLILSAVRVSEEEIKDRFRDRTGTMEAEYVLFDPILMVPDSMVVITEDDIQRHFNENQDEFKVRPARKLKYVLFSEAPSATDSVEILAEINRLKEQAVAGADFLDLAKTYSEIPPSDAFFKHGELSPAKEVMVFSAQKGGIVGPLADFDGYHLIKVLDERKGEKEYVRASHILFPANVADTSAQISKARDILRQIRNGADFSEMARKFGSDGTAPQGGDLGWGGKETWVKPFSDAAFRARIGEVIGPLRTQFGWHLIKVTGRDNREVKFADIAMRIKASSQSIDVMHQKAQDFAYLANQEGFEKSAENSGVQIRETPEFTKGGAIPGLGINDAAMNFGFSNGLDEISEPMSVSGGVAVFKVSMIREEGVRPLADVKNFVRSMVMRKKKLERIKERVQAFYGKLTPETDLIAAVRALKNVTVQKTGPFKPSDSPSGVGRDLAFLGTAIALKPGEISKPFEGSRGYYVMKVNSKAPFDSTLYATERSGLRDQILQEKKSRFAQEWLTALREKAEIEDHRYKFFR